MTVILSIQRDTDTYSRFEVEHREGMSILDALKAVSLTAPDVAYRWECGGQGICGVCTMMINGQPGLACTTLAQSGATYTLEPLLGFPIDKDLLVDFQFRLEALQTAKPYLIEGGKPIESKAEADASKLQRTCIESWACVAVCPVSLETDNLDALSMVKLARFALDPRDGADRKQMAIDGGLDVYSQMCPSCRRCMDVCPKGIDVYVDAVQVLQNLPEKDQQP